MGRVLQPFDYYEPSSLAEAFGLVQSPDADFIAGGVEVVLSTRRGAVKRQRLVSILGLPGLDKFSAHPKIGLEIGAAVKLSRLASESGFRSAGAPCTRRLTSCTRRTFATWAHSSAMSAARCPIRIFHLL